MQSVGLQGRSRRRRCRRRSIMHAIMHARTTRESMIECALAWLACMRIRQDGRPQGPATATAVSAVTTPPTPRARATLYVSNVDQRTSHVGMRECACTDIGLIRAHVVVRRRARALRYLGFISKGGGGAGRCRDLRLRLRLHPQLQLALRIRRAPPCLQHLLPAAQCTL